MATDIKQQYLESAGWALEAIKMAGTPDEMQIALSMLCSYFCIKMETHPDALREALTKNMKAIAEDGPLMLKMVEYIGNMEQERANDIKSPIIVN
jgi:hypothetical protein